MSLETGQIVDGKYRIVRELGSGAMGAVYEGEQFRIKRRVAIKVMSPRICGDENAARRFEREAQAAGRIGSEHIIEVLDLGTLADGGLFLVMELLEGCTLRERLERSGRLRPEQIVPLMQQLLAGLEAAQRAGIIHRDLKPDNVFLCREHAGIPDFVKLLDFGISKFGPLGNDAAMSMTRTGAILGTPHYMSPEQARGARDVDHRSDLYSVGVMMYQALSGQRPFQADTFNELVFKVGLETPPPLESFVPELDPAFAALVRRAMARAPSDRHQSAAELRDALGAWLHRGSPEPAGQRRSLGTATLAISGPQPPAPIDEDALATLYLAPREPSFARDAAISDPRTETQRSHPKPKGKALPVALLAAATFTLGGLLAWQTGRVPQPLPDGASPAAADAPRAAGELRPEHTHAALPSVPAAPAHALAAPSFTAAPAAPSFAAAPAGASVPSASATANATPAPHPKNRPGAVVDALGDTAASPSKSTRAPKDAQAGGRRIPTGL